jgi:murein DD-endopeptidase MepM/ murein hydrolase activator NlpD
MTVHSFIQLAHRHAVAASHAVQATAAHTWQRLRPLAERAAERGRDAMRTHPAYAAVALLTVGALVGTAGQFWLRDAEYTRLKAEVLTQRENLEATRREAQREVNALAARLGELQAEASRLNALGERLTRVAQLGDGEFDFDKPVGVGGAGPVRDMPATELRTGLAALDTRLHRSGSQLSVLEALLFNRELDKNTLPTGHPIANSYITSGYGYRANPLGGGSQYHKGVDFEADIGDPVLAVADGVVTFSGTRSGYGNVVEIDHGNGYVTRYAHNSLNVGQVGDLVRRGQKIAKAGSTGRSTGPHVHLEVWENGVAINPERFLGGAAAPAPAPVLPIPLERG